MLSPPAKRLAPPSQDPSQHACYLIWCGGGWPRLQTFSGPWGEQGPEPGGNVLDMAAAARIAVSPTRTMEQRGMGDGGNEEEVDDHVIGEEMTATATAADGRPFLGATAG